MPFTLAHPAVVLPLVRRPFVASALVAGAVAPDLLYVGPIYRIATQQINGNFTLTLTHELTSALWLDPLQALLLLAVFNLGLKRPLMALASSALAGRLKPSRFRLPSVAVVLWTVASAVVGAVTHVVWDSFTHGDGYFVRQFPGIFRAQVTGAWDVNRILQYVSTLGGCLVLAVWLYRWYRRTAPQPVDERMPTWLRYLVYVAAIGLAVGGAVVELGRVDGGFSGEIGVRTVLTGLMSGGLIAVGAYVVVWHLERLRRRTHVS
ncbi:uncharacterized protein DUF4184 [Kribbella sp. VKM Ac-2571]|uniref:DUF4184 family protein n=1 Tax=Kribbella sp. VKM Ac-2571 TaxID=2512222 RepID=UPI0010607954|nr:DUF4184 family protein [Kribbella sp. VKM Ac-2571]TDO60944.1 uncharacterized protein DUF4184 [Kribbella sp. VKM Ac-2571]